MISHRRKRCGPSHTFFFAPLRACAAPLLLGLAAAPLLLGLAACLGSGGLPPPLSEVPPDRTSEQTARGLYDRGVGEVGERRYEAAYAAFDSVVMAYPGSRWSSLSLRERGLAGYRLGRHTRAAEDLARFLDLAPGYESVDTAIVLASARHRGGEPEAALRVLARGVPERDTRSDEARNVAEAAVRDLGTGRSSGLAAELPERAFLVPLYLRAADEERGRDPSRAAELTRLAERVGGRRNRQSGGVSVEDPDGEAGGALVGAILPQGGRLAGVAQDIQDGVRLALEELAVTGRRYDLQVMPEEGSGASLLALAERGARVVIGPLGSEAALDAAPAARDREMLVVTPTATDTTLVHAGPGVVALNAVRGELGEAMGRFAAEDLRLLRVATLGSDDAYGRANAAAFRAAFQSRGGQVVLESFFSRGSTSFGASLRRARLQGAQALFLPTRSADQVLTIFSQMEYYSGGRFRMLGTEIWRDDRFLSRAGSFAEGGYFADTFSPDPRVTRHWDFRAAYSRRYGRSPETNFPAWGYDAATLALRYLTVPADSREGAPPAEATYVGAAATYRIRGRDVKRVPVISRIDGGSPSLVLVADAR